MLAIHNNDPCVGATGVPGEGELVVSQRAAAVLQVQDQLPHGVQDAEASQDPPRRGSCVHGKCIAPDTCACAHVGSQLPERLPLLEWRHMRAADWRLRVRSRLAWRRLRASVRGAQLRRWLPCEEECPKDDKCPERCRCQNGGQCDFVTGACECPAGWTGEVCANECPTGRWGERCERTCECANRAGCHHVTGKCLCEAGFTGDKCLETCPLGTFGVGCAGQCACSHGGSCSARDGSCTCKPGWAGARCERRARVPASARCSRTARAAGTRSCLCAPGYRGVHCEESCPPPLYGDNCADTCQCMNNATRMV
ncbi:unnamed protein product [Leptidea sinapis]|uniref:EGF-like domain-containing protein n=1 Tax=Leptidea sinapis TaxID=189913 RepID=A0A5E4R6G2_9NEOP|nr:unnamed protein product [Leptidea sinapis]